MDECKPNTEERRKMPGRREHEAAGEECVSSSTCLARMDGIKSSIQNWVGARLWMAVSAIIVTLVGVSWNLSAKMTTLQDFSTQQGKEITAQGKEIQRIEENLKIPPAGPPQSYTGPKDPDLSRRDEITRPLRALTE